MKRQVQQAGIRDWFGPDFISLQSEPMKILDGVLAQLGGYVVSGCDITANGDKYDVSPGLVMLSGKGPDGNDISVVAPYEGTNSPQTLPLYLTMGCDVIEDTYGDGQSKPVAYHYKAVTSSLKPAGPCLEISVDETLRFKDALRLFLQDASHRFITDAERAAWSTRTTDILPTQTLSDDFYMTYSITGSRLLIEGITLQPYYSTTYTPRNELAIRLPENVVARLHPDAFCLQQLIGLGTETYDISLTVDSPGVLTVHSYTLIHRSNTIRLSLPVLPYTLFPLKNIPVGTNLRGKTISCLKAGGYNSYFYYDYLEINNSGKGGTSGTIGSGSGSIEVYLGVIHFDFIDGGSDPVLTSEYTLPDEEDLIVTRNNMRSDFENYHGYGLYLKGEI